jgi:hypothetical protein
MELGAQKQEQLLAIGSFWLAVGLEAGLQSAKNKVTVQLEARLDRVSGQGV